MTCQTFCLPTSGFTKLLCHLAGLVQALHVWFWRDVGLSASAPRAHRREGTFPHCHSASAGTTDSTVLALPTDLSFPALGRGAAGWLESSWAWGTCGSTTDRQTDGRGTHRESQHHLVEVLIPYNSLLHCSEGIFGTGQRDKRKDVSNSRGCPPKIRRHWDTGMVFIYLSSLGPASC